MKKHLTKWELLEQVRTVQQLKLHQDGVAYTTLTVINYWILWKMDGFGRKRLSDYNDRFQEYERKIDNLETTLENLNNRFYEKSGEIVENIPMNENNTKVRKNAFLERIDREQMKVENKIIEMQCRHMLIHYNVLIDLGYGKQRLLRNKAQFDQITEEYGDKGSAKLRKELFDGLGIMIENPQADVSKLLKV